ncbi:MAG: mercuric ion transport protein [Oceanospirillaceae bacterium]|jgi:mercuric ion transport protein
MENRATNISLIGGVFAAIGAGLCCAGPLVLLLLGIGGSWIGNLVLFEPYRPLFIIGVIIFFAIAGYKLHSPQENCQPNTACTIPKVQKRRKVIFWIAAAIAFILVTSNYWVLWLF